MIVAAHPETQFPVRPGLVFRGWAFPDPGVGAGSGRPALRGPLSYRLLTAGPAAGPAVVEGVDFCTLAPDGRLASVVGFIDKMPG